MNTNIKTSVILFLAAVTAAACSSAPTPTPTPKNDPYNSSDSQRSRAHQTQDELSSETRKK